MEGLVLHLVIRTQLEPQASAGEPARSKKLRRVAERAAQRARDRDADPAGDPTVELAGRMVAASLTNRP